MPPARPLSLGASRRFAVSVLAWAIAALIGETALAFELRWQAPSGCPTEAEVRQRLTQSSGGDSGLTAAEVSVSAVSGGFRADVTTKSEGRTGRRELKAKDCKQLTDAVVVVLSLLLRDGDDPFVPAAPPAPSADGVTPPNGTAPAPNGAAPPPGSVAPVGSASPDGAAPPSGSVEPPPEVPPPGSVPPPTAPLPPPSDVLADPEETENADDDELEAEPEREDEEADDEEEPEAEPESPARVEAPSAPFPDAEFALRAAVGVTAFDAGPAEIAGAVHARARWASFAAELQLGYHRPLATSVVRDVELSTQSAELALFGCAVFGERPQLAACLGSRAELLFATASSVAEPKVDSALIPHAAIGLRLSTPLRGRLGLFVAADGDLRLRKVRLGVQPYGSLRALSTTGASLLAGPEIAF